MEIITPLLSRGATQEEKEEEFPMVGSGERERVDSYSYGYS